MAIQRIRLAIIEPVMIIIIMAAVTADGNVVRWRYRIVTLYQESIGVGDNKSMQTNHLFRQRRHPAYPGGCAQRQADHFKAPGLWEMGPGAMIKCHQ